MRRRLFGAVLCFLLLPVIGLARLLWSVLRALAWRPRNLLVVGGLAVAVSSTDPIRILAPDGIGPLGHMIPFGIGALGIAVLWHGMRSREIRVLWRWLDSRAADF